MRELVQWQVIDPSNNCVFPWFTHPFLTVLASWTNLEGKRILEYGGGRSTAWWRKKCWYVCTIDTNQQWAADIAYECNYAGVPGNGDILFVDASEGDRTREAEYVHAGDEFGPFDIIVVDGIFRYECMIHGISLLSKNGGILIVDNWDQDGFLCPACVALMETYTQMIFPQHNHTDHHGNKWKTAYFIIPRG